MAKNTGFGYRFQLGNGAAPEVFTTVAGSTGVAGPNTKRDTVESTDADDVSTKTASYVSKGYRDTGTMTMTGHLQDGNASQTAVETAMASDAAVNFKVVDRASNTVTTGSILLNQFDRDRQQDAVMSYTIGGQTLSATHT